MCGKCASSSLSGSPSQSSMLGASLSRSPLVWYRDGLQHRPAPGPQHASDDGEVGHEVLVAHSLDHLDADHLVVGAGT